MKQRKMLRFWAILLTWIFVLGMIPTPVQAAAVVYTSELENRSAAEVAQHYSDARYAAPSYSERDSSTWYNTPASIVSPYAAGVLTDDTLLAMRSMTNFYRWLVGVDELVDKTYSSDESLQAQALDRNFEFNHIISDDSKPADMDQKLWNQGVACDHNILARYYAPMSAITAWMNEGYIAAYGMWDTVGHRYALISANYTDIQFGYSGRVAIGKIIASGGSMGSTAFAAFPCPGYMPADLISPSSSAWSVQINTNLLSITSSVTVTIKNEATNKVYTRTGSSQVKTSVDLIQFAQPPVNADSYSGRYSGEYSVVITGLTDKATGKAAEIQYTTKFGNVSDSAESYVTEAASDTSKYVIYKTMAGSLDKIMAILPQEITVTAETGATAKVPVLGVWKLEKTDETNGYFVNSASANDLPENMNDKNGVLERIAIPYEISNDEYVGYNSFSFGGVDFSFDIETETFRYSAAEGTEVKFKIHPTFLPVSRSQVFRLSSANTAYSAEKAFDSATDESTYADNYITYSRQVTESDSGEYISVYYNSKEAYVSTGTKTLTVAPCSHIWDEGKVTKEPTCTDPGEMTYTCTLCGGTKTEEIAAVGHKWDEGEVTVEATCGTEGEKTYTCSLCGETKTEIIPATGIHTGGEATCIHKAVCEVCGEEYGTLDSTNHEGPTEVRNIQEASCTAEGYSGDTYCTACNGLVEEGQVIPAAGHQFGDWETLDSPNCEDKGSKKRVCSVCGYTETEEVDASGHDWETEYTVDKEPTCTEEGSKSIHCKNCDAVKDNKTIAALGHDFAEYSSNNDATCIKDGTKSSKCTRCGATDTITDKGSKLGHKFGEYKSNNDATCTKDGTKTATCGRCGEKDTVTDEGTKLPHTGGTATCAEAAVCEVCGTPYGDLDPENHIGETEIRNAVTATCAVEGYTGDTYCKGCDELLQKGEATEKTDHTFGDWVTVKPAGCVDKGTEERKCDICEYTEQRELAPTGHDWDTEYVTDKEATCTEEGSRSRHCKKCDAITDPEIIPALGHDFAEYISDGNATCKEDGTKTASCSRCDATDTITDPGTKLTTHTGGTATCIHKAVCEVCGEEYGTLDSTNHEGPTGVRNIQEASCTAEGYSGDTYCIACDGLVEEGQVIPAAGHQFGDWETLDSPNCEDKGSKKRVCSVCGYTETEEVDASGHDWETEYTVDKQPGCTEEGSESIHCKNCDAVKDSRSIAPLGHRGGTATCIQKAVCEVCGQEYGNPDPANHTGELVLKNERDATCETTGYTGDLFCKDCNTLVEEGEVLAMLAHSYENGVCFFCGALEPEKNSDPAKPDKVGTTDSTDKGDTTGSTGKKDSKDTGTTGKNGKSASANGQAANTGDSSHVGLYVVLFLAASLVLVMIMRKKIH